MTVSNSLWNDFTQYCVTVLQYNPKSTVPERIRKLKYMEKEGFNLLVFSKDDFYNFIYHRMKKGTPATGLNHYVKAVNSWCKFRGLDYCFKKHKEHYLPVRIPSIEDLQSLLGVCSGRNSICRRDRMIIIFFCKTGLRISELCNLKLSDIDWLNKEILVRSGKGGKHRIIPVEPKLLISKNYPCLHNYIKLWRVDNSQYLFTTYKGKIKVDYLRKRIKDIGKKAGLNWIHPHSFRHFYATNLRRSGVPLYIIKEVLGHSDIRATMIYEHIFLSDIRESFNKVIMIDFLGRYAFSSSKMLVKDKKQDLVYKHGFLPDNIKGVYKNGPGRKQFCSIPKILQVKTFFSSLLTTDYFNRLVSKAVSNNGLEQSLANPLIVEGFVMPKHKKSSHGIPLAGTLVPN